MEALRAEIAAPLRPAIEVDRPFPIVTRASSATLGDKSVAPAPVSMAKLNGPAELIQVLTIKPRPGTSRNEAGRGTLSSTVARPFVRWRLFWATERAAPNEAALATVVRIKNTANRSLAL